MLAAIPASAQEAAIRKSLSERLPNLPKVDEVTKLPIAGLWEVRIGADIFYTDEQGQYLIQGELIDLRARTNLTKQRIDKLTAFDFDKLPLKDAIAIKQGKGTRKMAVFVDPNCGYCKRFERDVSNLKDVTVYIYLYPILGADSQTKSRDIWCAKDPALAWRDWMLANKLPSSAPAKCDFAAIERNVELGRKHRVTGTPATVFEDDTRLPGAVPGEQLDKQLVQAARKG
jgi:thiol:disulfide interchange protein DsbC